MALWDYHDHSRAKTYLHLFLLILRIHLRYKLIIHCIKINKLIFLVFFKLRPDSCGFNKLVFKYKRVKNEKLIAKTLFKT
jgi:hypothetical protein